MPEIYCPVSDSSSLTHHELLSWVELDFHLASCGSYFAGHDVCRDYHNLALPSGILDPLGIQ